MVWNDLAGLWAGFCPPLCPDSADVAAFAEAIAGRDNHVLLLGVTPQLAGLGQRLTAVDHSPQMIARVWPGNTAQREAIEGEWLGGIPADRGYSAVISDGGLICLRWPDEYLVLLAELRRVCAPGFRLALRCHLAENFGGAVPLEALAAEVAATLDPDPHSVRHRIAHARVLAGEAPNIVIAELADHAQQMVHHAPAARTVLENWPRPSAENLFSFPTRTQIEALLRDAGMILRDEPPPRGFVIADAG